jgi:molybdopterin-guanine dinucleotide biosynthesis adapter protein
MSPYVLGFAGYSGSGKTTLLTQLIARLKARGLRIGVVKHTHHEFDIDHPGKDSYELRHAGAARIAIGSSKRWALVTERPTPVEPTLGEMLGVLGADALDLILVEGFRHEPFPKIEVHRPSLGRDLLAASDASIIAIATDVPTLDGPALPRLGLNDVAAIETFVLELIQSAT